jgi:hypothetical protein
VMGAANNPAPFWVYTAPNGLARVHRVNCTHCLPGKRPTAAHEPGWSPCDDYASARVYAEHVRDRLWAHLDVDCRRCKPGSPSHGSARSAQAGVQLAGDRGEGLVTADQFAARIEALIAEADDDGLSVVDQIEVLDRIVKAMKDAAESPKDGGDQ